MDNLATAHAAAEQLAVALIVVGVKPCDVAEALVTTGLAFLAADHPEAAIALIEAYAEVRNG